MLSPAPTEPPPAEPREVLSRLRRGDTLAHCQATGRRLVRADLLRRFPLRGNADVDDLTVRVLLEAPWSTRAREGRRGGRLVPQDDGLPGIGAAQTWFWVEGGDRDHR